jgi:hypothetical protein
LISRQEHEAWAALLACQGQMRLAPSGHVIGIDLNTVLNIAAAGGSDLARISHGEVQLGGAGAQSVPRSGSVAG